MPVNVCACVCVHVCGVCTRVYLCWVAWRDDTCGGKRPSSSSMLLSKNLPPWRPRPPEPRGKHLWAHLAARGLGMATGSSCRAELPCQGVCGSQRGAGPCFWTSLEVRPLFGHCPIDGRVLPQGPGAGFVGSRKGPCALLGPQMVGDPPLHSRHQPFSPPPPCGLCGAAATCVLFCPPPPAQGPAHVAAVTHRGSVLVAAEVAAGRLHVNTAHHLWALQSPHTCRDSWQGAGGTESV